MYIVFTRIPGESYRKRLKSLWLYLCYVFRALLNSIVVDFPVVCLCVWGGGGGGGGDHVFILKRLYTTLFVPMM